MPLSKTAKLNILIACSASIVIIVAVCCIVLIAQANNASSSVAITLPMMINGSKWQLYTENPQSGGNFTTLTNNSGSLILTNASGNINWIFDLVSLLSDQQAIYTVQSSVSALYINSQGTGSTTLSTTPQNLLITFWNVSGIYRNGLAVAIQDPYGNFLGINDGATPQWNSSTSSIIDIQNRWYVTTL